MIFPLNTTGLDSLRINPARSIEDPVIGRRYRTPEGKLYPSVTTVLGDDPEKEKGLQKWRDRVGEEYAKNYTLRAGTRGSRIHKMMEEYILDGKKPSFAIPTTMLTFKQLQGEVDAHLKEVRGVELPLYSDKLRLGGRLDLFAVWDEYQAIVDFKSSVKQKLESYIKGYFLQTTAYSLMLEERTGYAAKKIVVLIAVDQEFAPQVFIKDRSEYVDELLELVEKYHKEHNT